MRRSTSPPLGSDQRCRRSASCQSGLPKAKRAATAALLAPPVRVSLPVGFTVFPGEIYRAPRRWAEEVYPNLVYFHEADRGGHFAAWEEPQLFASELRAAFRSLR